MSSKSLKLVCSFSLQTSPQRFEGRDDRSDFDKSSSVEWHVTQNRKILGSNLTSVGFETQPRYRGTSDLQVKFENTPRLTLDE